VSFVIAGPWSRSARAAAQQTTPTLVSQLMTGFTSLVIPGLFTATAQPEARV
jgi:hypothetical protein